MIEYVKSLPVGALAVRRMAFGVSSAVEIDWSLAVNVGATTIASTVSPSTNRPLTVTIAEHGAGAVPCDANVTSTEVRLAASVEDTGAATQSGFDESTLNVKPF